jgi:hypothetical protein
VFVEDITDGQMLEHYAGCPLITFYPKKNIYFSANSRKEGQKCMKRGLKQSFCVV